MYGRRLIDLPRARRTLGEATATLWLAEAGAVTAARAAHRSARHGIDLARLFPVLTVPPTS